MALSIGIVGLPNVGKSTLFKALTKNPVDCSNYPFCTIDPNVGVVEVPDERVDKLAELSSSAKKIYSAIEFYDIAGLVEGAHRGEGLGNQFLAHIRETDAVLYVLRIFQNEKVVNTRERIDVLKDKEILDTEMALKDLAAVERRLASLEKEVKKGDKHARQELKLFEKLRGFLGKGELLSEKEFIEEEKDILKQYQFLTLKPRLYLLNGSQNELTPEAKEIFEKNSWQYIILDVLTEFEASDFSVEERKALGLAEKSGFDLLIKESYKLLDLIIFLTTGEKETRAWTLKRGSQAPQAGGVIHSDFEEKFIKADVIGCQDLLGAGSYAKAREKGLLRTEGKDYVVKDGDVIIIKAGV